MGGSSRQALTLRNSQGDGMSLHEVPGLPAAQQAAGIPAIRPAWTRNQQLTKQAQLARGQHQGNLSL